MEHHKLIELKEILKGFEIESHDIDSETLGLIRAGAVSLTDMCDKELSYKGNTEYWSLYGVIRVLSKGDNFTRDDGARVKKL